MTTHYYSRNLCCTAEHCAKIFFLPSYIREGLDCIRGCIFSFFGDYFWKCTNKPSIRIVKPVLTITSEQRPRPAWIPCPTKPTMNLPSILDHHLNNGHFFGVPRMAVVHRFDCFRNVKPYKKIHFWGKYFFSVTHAWLLPSWML